MEPDEWHKRWRKGLPFGTWPFADLDEMMREMERSFSEQFKDLEKDVPKSLVREKRLPDGSTTKEIGPIVYGYSVTIGPDGKPEIREFGNVKRGGAQPWKEIQDKREPLVDILTTDKDVRVLAEVPGVSKGDINVTVNGNRAVISVDTPERKYYKEVEIPSNVDPEGAKSSYNNGILEITLPLKSNGPKGVRLKVD
ncbi:MAG: Hsp20/alpha crystallin family protein [Thaumarchaeota archaeon]|nr:Hsp20/alpha crystallin family protein [Nitrososphaerota archaeon]